MLVGLMIFLCWEVECYGVCLRFSRKCQVAELVFCFFLGSGMLGVFCTFYAGKSYVGGFVVFLKWVR